MKKGTGSVIKWESSTTLLSYLSEMSEKKTI